MSIKFDPEWYSWLGRDGAEWRKRIVRTQVEGISIVRWFVVTPSPTERCPDHNLACANPLASLTNKKRTLERHKQMTWPDGKRRETIACTLEWIANEGECASSKGYFYFNERRPETREIFADDSLIDVGCDVVGIESAASSTIIGEDGIYVVLSRSDRFQVDKSRIDMLSMRSD